MENISEYIFALNWEDTKKNIRKVGYLAKLEEAFYLIISDKENAEKAYESGFIGIPGFQAGEVYKSETLFDFFQRRVLDVEEPYKEFKTNGAKSMVDSFTVEEVAKTMFSRYKKAILKVYDVQCKQREIKKKKEEDKLDTKPSVTSGR